MKICRIKDCGLKHYAKGYCRNHYSFFRYNRKTGRFNEILANKCKIQECQGKPIAKNLCSRHYARLRHHKSFERLSPKGKRNVNWKGGIAEYPNHCKNNLLPTCHKCNSKQSSKFYKKFGYTLDEITEKLKFTGKSRSYWYKNQDKIKNLFS